MLKKRGFFFKCSSYILLASFMHGVLFGALVPGKGEEIIVVVFFSQQLEIFLATSCVQDRTIVYAQKAAGNLKRSFIFF